MSEWRVAVVVGFLRADIQAMSYVEKAAIVCSRLCRTRGRGPKQHLPTLHANLHQDHFEHGDLHQRSHVI